VKNALPGSEYEWHEGLRRGETPAEELIMWDDESNIFKALDEHDLECEPDEDFSDLELDSDVAEDAEEEDFDEED